MANKSWTQRQKSWKSRGKQVSPNFSMKKNGVGEKIAYMNVPAASVTLPQDAHVIQRKRLYKKDIKTGANSYETYVLCAGTKRNYVSKQTKNPVMIQNWYVAKLNNYKGLPSVAEFLYKGTSERDARHRFGQIPYNEMLVAVTDNVTKLGNASSFQTDANGKKWAIFSSNGKYASIVRNQIRRRQYSKARRSAFAN